MADLSQVEPNAPVPKPRPRRARTVLAAVVSTANESQQDSPPLDRRRGGSEGDVAVAGSLLPFTGESVSSQPTRADNCHLSGRPWTSDDVTDEPLHEEPANGTGCDGGPASNASDSRLQSLTDKLTVLRLEEERLQERVRERRRECEEVERRVKEMREEEELKTALGEKERGAATNLNERELELQRRLDEVNDRESSIKQENLKLQRLADQLHMQKKDLEHQRFDLQNFGSPDGLSGEKMAQLREREERVDHREKDLEDRERELDRRQANFQKWMRERQNEIEQRLSELQVNNTEQTPPSSSSTSTSSSYVPTVMSTHTQPQQLYSHYRPPPHPSTSSSSSAASFYPPPPPPQHSQPAPVPHGGAYEPVPSNNMGTTVYRQPGYYAGPQPQPMPPQTIATPYYHPSPPQDTLAGHFTTSHPPPPPPHLPLSSSSSSSSLPRSQRAGNFTHAGHSYNDLSERPPTVVVKRSPSEGFGHSGGEGVASGVRGGVASGGGGVASGGGGGVATGGSAQKSTLFKIDKDEEVAHQMTFTSQLWQTTDDISADAEYARKLQQELNIAASPPATAVDQDHQLALAMLADGNEEFLNLSDPEEVQRLIDVRMKVEEERKKQEERDAELARRLEIPEGEAD